MVCVCTCVCVRVCACTYVYSCACVRVFIVQTLHTYNMNMSPILYLYPTFNIIILIAFILHVQWLILIRAPRDQSPGTIGGMHQRTTRRFCWSVDAKKTAGMVDVHFWLVTG